MTAPAPEPATTPITTAQPTSSVQPATAASTITPASTSPPSDGPLLDGGDLISLGALIVGAIAAAIALKARGDSRRSANAAVRSADAADRAAKANEDMVIEQKTSNRLSAEEIAMLRQQRDDEQIEADARLADQARLIHCQVADMGGLQVSIENMSPLPVTALRLVDVVGTPDDWMWQLNPRVIGNRTVHDALQPGQDRTFFLEFRDAAGVAQRSAGDSYAVTFRFTDACGQRWERVSKGAPRQVPTDDSDLETQPAPAP